MARQVKLVKKLSEAGGSGGVKWIPEGYYLFKAEELDIWVDEGRGIEYILVRFVIQGSGTEAGAEFVGRQFTEFCGNTEELLWKFANFAEASQGHVPDVDEIDLDDYVGSIVVAKASDNEYQGKVRSQMRYEHASKWSRYEAATTDAEALPPDDFPFDAPAQEPEEEEPEDEVQPEPEPAPAPVRPKVVARPAAPAKPQARVKVNL